MDKIEPISWEGKPLAYLVRGPIVPEVTTFVTPSESNLQAGFVVYPAGGTIKRHRHKPLERRIVGTAEVLIVKKGRCRIDLYSDRGVLVASRELREGDLVVMVAGGHGFEMLEDTVFVEIKQGPYTGKDEKEVF